MSTTSRSSTRWPSRFRTTTCWRARGSDGYDQLVIPVTSRGSLTQHEEPARVPRFESPRGGRGLNRASHSRRHADSAPPAAVRTLARGPCGDPLATWRRLRSSRGCRGGGAVESTAVGRADRRARAALLELDPDARQSARVLAAGLRCQGRRYNELSETLHRLVAEEFVDHDQRPGTTNRGYALTQEGRLRAASLRAAADSRVCAKNTEEAATVSEPGSPGMAGNGNATVTPAEVRERQSGNAEADDIADGRRHENLRERRAGDGVPEDGRGRRGARA